MIRRRPAAASGPASFRSAEPFVVRVRSRTPSIAASIRTRSGRSCRTVGSPPVIRSFSTPRPDEEAGQPGDLLVGQDLRARQERVVAPEDLRRHAVGAAEVAAVGDRDPQVVHAPAQQVGGGADAGVAAADGSRTGGRLGRRCRAWPAHGRRGGRLAAPRDAPAAEGRVRRRRRPAGRPVTRRHRPGAGRHRRDPSGTTGGARRYHRSTPPHRSALLASAPGVIGARPNAQQGTTQHGNHRFPDRIPPSVEHGSGGVPRGVGRPCRGELAGRPSPTAGTTSDAPTSHDQRGRDRGRVRSQQEGPVTTLAPGRERATPLPGQPEDTRADASRRDAGAARRRPAAPPASRARGAPARRAHEVPRRPHAGDAGRRRAGAHRDARAVPGRRHDRHRADPCPLGHRRGRAAPAGRRRRRRDQGMVEGRDRPDPRGDGAADRRPARAARGSARAARGAHRARDREGPRPHRRPSRREMGALLRRPRRRGGPGRLRGPRREPARSRRRSTTSTRTPSPRCSTSRASASRPRAPRSRPSAGRPRRRGRRRGGRRGRRAPSRTAPAEPRVEATPVADATSRRSTARPAIAASQAAAEAAAALEAAEARPMTPRPPAPSADAEPARPSRRPSPRRRHASRRSPPSPRPSEDAEATGTTLEPGARPAPRDARADAGLRRRRGGRRRGRRRPRSTRCPRSAATPSPPASPASCRPRRRAEPARDRHDPGRHDRPRQRRQHRQLQAPPRSPGRRRPRRRLVGARTASSSSPSQHDPAASLRDLIPTLPGFGARVVGAGDGIVQVSAQDPQD